MCWSGEASASLAILGFSGAFFEYRKMKKHQQGYLDKYGLRCVGIFYLSLMETLQAVNYTVLYTPGFFNSLCALLGYMHICFQPIFVNLIYLSLITEKRKEYWFKYVMICGVISAIALLSRLFTSPYLPSCFINQCTPVAPDENFLHLVIMLKKTVGCTHDNFMSYRGDWHIAWKWPLNGCNPIYFTYIFTVFILPIMYGATLPIIMTTLLGPVSTFFLTINPDEFGAVWCLFAIGLASSVKLRPWERMITNPHDSWQGSIDAFHKYLHRVHYHFHHNQLH